MTETDEVRMLAFIERCDDPDSLRQIMENARARGGTRLVDAAFRKLIEILPAEQPGTVEHDFWRSIHAFELVLSEENGKTTRLSRTRQKVKRVGVIQTLVDWAVAKQESPGFRMLIERGMPELSGEAIVLRHPEHFAAEVAEAARARLEAADDDAEAR